jgi:hypothetical protein
MIVMPQYSKIICVALCSALPGLLASTLAQAIVAYSSVERIESTDAGSNWAYDNNRDTQFLAGASSTAGKIFETVLLIDISSFDREIASASSITFNIAYDQKLGKGQDVTAYLFGTNVSMLVDIGATNFHKGGLESSHGGTIKAEDFFAPGVATYDVTAIVQGFNGFNYIGVLLTSEITSNYLGTGDAISFYRQAAKDASEALDDQDEGGGYLVIIPEPEACTLFAGLIGFWGTLVRRRR